LDVFLQACQDLREAEDRIHRRADLVAHVGQERALGLVGRLRFGSSLLLGLCPGLQVLQIGEALETVRQQASRYRVSADRFTGSSSIQWTLGKLLVPPLSNPHFQLPGGAILEARIDDPTGRQRYLTMNVLPGAFHLVEFGQLSGASSGAVYAFVELGHVAEIPVAPGLYSVLVSPGSNPQDYRYHTVVAEIIAGDHEVMEASLPDAMADLTLTGSVRRIPDDTTSSVWIYAYDRDAQLLAETSVNGDGRYELPLPAGQYEIIAYVRTPDDTRVGYHRRSVMLTEDHTLDIDLFTQTAIADDSQSPSHFALAQSYPNPFNAETVIRFSLATPGEARLELFDMLGQRVRTLVESELPAGPAATRWDGTDTGGHPVASGVYFYRLNAGERVATKKLLLLR